MIVPTGEVYDGLMENNLFPIESYIYGMASALYAKTEYNAATFGLKERGEGSQDVFSTIINTEVETYDNQNFLNIQKKIMESCKKVLL